MLAASGKPPDLPRARKRDAIAEARASRSDEYVRDPKRERQAIIRFLAYLKPHMGLFAFATLCGIANYYLQAMVPNVQGYIIDRMLRVQGIGRPTKHNPLYPIFDRYLNRFAPHAGHMQQADLLLGTLIVCL